MTSILPNHRSSTRTLIVLCVSSWCWGFSFGVGAPLASLWLKDAGCNATLIGLNTGVYYLGIALTAALVPWMMRRWNRGCLVAGMVTTGLTVALFPWGGSLIGWFLLRLLSGFAGAMSLIPTEALVNRNAAPEQRSRDFGFYAFSMATGIALGTLIGVQMYSVAPRLAFLMGGTAALVAGAIVFGWLEWPQAVQQEEEAAGRLDWAGNFLSLGSAWSQGFLEGGMVALLPIYLLAIGLPAAGVGWLMSGIMTGVIAAQVPLAWLADRLGRMTVLLGCYGVTSIVLAAVLCGLNLWGLAVCLFLAGACSSAFYPLGLARLGERVPAGALPRASAWFLGTNCLGSLVGPVLSGVAMDWFGPGALFAAGLSSVLLVLLVWASISMHLRTRQTEFIEPVPVEKRRAA